MYFGALKLKLRPFTNGKTDLIGLKAWKLAAFVSHSLRLPLKNIYGEN